MFNTLSKYVIAEKCEFFVSIISFLGYMTTCIPCTVAKVPLTIPAGKLMPLPTPQHSFSHIFHTHSNHGAYQQILKIPVSYPSA